MLGTVRGLAAAAQARGEPGRIQVEACLGEPRTEALGDAPERLGELRTGQELRDHDVMAVGQVPVGQRERETACLTTCRLRVRIPTAQVVAHAVHVEREGEGAVAHERGGDGRLPDTGRAVDQEQGGHGATLGVTVEGPAVVGPGSPRPGR